MLEGRDHGTDPRQALGGGGGRVVIACSDWA